MADGNSGFDELLTKLASELSSAQGAGSDTASSLGALTGADATQGGAPALTAAVEQLQAVQQVQTGVGPETSNGSSAGGSALDAVGSAVTDVFTSGLGVSGLISGLVSLFGGGGDSSTPPPLSVYTAPESLQFEGDVDRGGNTTDWSGGDATAAAPQSSGGAQQITVQVNAMDSQSFLDHSQDIARAVRQAMLNSNSLNDVVSDL